jgi:carbon monoxide dehydrogenase subunit G
MKFTSDKTLINKPANRIYKFLSNFNNFEHLMPDEITNWKSDEDSCAFTVQNMADISMKIHEKVVDTKVHMTSHGKVPFDFDLITHLEPVDENNTKVHIEIDANLNPMMKMMVQRPLKNLVNIMAEKLKHHHEDKDNEQEA